MAPKRKQGAKPSPAPSLSPRRTRSSSAKPAAPPAEQPPPAKKQKQLLKKKGKAKKSDAPAPAAAAGVSGTDSSKTIIVEACNQCHQFKKTALMVKNGLESGVPGITVTINPDKPRRGCFEIRDPNGETFLSLLKMVRPFTPMRELDMDEVISDIIGKIK